MNITKRVRGVRSNKTFSLQFLDGWNSAYSLTGEILNNKWYVSGKFEWPYYLTHWKNAVRSKTSRVIGIFTPSVFQGIVQGISPSGIECKSIIYLLEGTGHLLQKEIELAIEESNQHVMSYDHLANLIPDDHSDNHLTNLEGTQNDPVHSEWSKEASSIATEGKWSGYSIPYKISNCPGIRREVVGWVEDGNLKLILQDGWEVEHKADGDIRKGGLFSSNILQWPRYLSGWAQSPNKTASQLVGFISKDTFQGIIRSTSGGRGCDTLVYLGSGNENNSVHDVKDRIRIQQNEVLSFEQILYRFDRQQGAALIQPTVSRSQLPSKDKPARSKIQEDFRLIKQLLNDGLITNEEAAAKRAELLSRF